jgi:cobalt-zinc-cadmium efflux system outer membrane protein
MKSLFLSHTTRVLATITLLALPGLSSAITLSTAVNRTLEASPELQPYPYHIRALDAEAQQAGFKPNPQLNAELENVLGTGENRMLKNAAMTLSLSQLIELGHKAERRVEVIDRQTAAFEQEYQVKRLDVVAAMMRDFYNSLRLQQLIDWNQQRIQSEKDAVKVIQLRARAGVVGQADVLRMQLRLAQSQARQAELEEQHSQSLSVLASNWADEPDFDVVDGELRQIPTLPQTAALKDALLATPDYLLARAQTRINEARLSLAEAQSQADITVGAGIRRLQDTHDTALLFSFSMPLQWHDKNQGNIARAQARYQERLANETLLKSRLEVALSRIHNAMKNNLSQLNRLDADLRPVADRLLSEVQRGYKLGQYDVLQWVDAQQELFTIERQLIEAQHAVHLQFLELERLSGASLTTTADKE